MKEEVTNSVSGIEGKKEPLNKKKMAKRKKKKDCPMKESKELSFTKSNFMKLAKAGNGVVVFGTGGGYSDTSEFKLSGKILNANTDKKKVDMFFNNAKQSVNGAKDPNMKGRTFKIRAESYRMNRYAGQDWDGTGATYIVGKIAKAKKAGKSSTPKKDKGKPSKENQDIKGNGNVKEYYVSPEGFVLFAEAGVLRSVMRNKNGRMVKVRIHKKAHKGAADVTTGGKKRTRSSIRKNVLKMGGISKMKKKSRKLKKTLKKGKARRAVGSKKVSRINISKRLK